MRIFKAGSSNNERLIEEMVSGVLRPCQPNRFERTPPTNVGGFSLVELVAVIFVLVLMVAITYPKIRIGGDLKTVSRQLIGTIQHTYSIAESEKQPYRLHYDLLYGEYWVSPASTKSDDDASQDAKPDKLRRLPKGIRFAKIETLYLGTVLDGRAFTHFYPIGRVEPTVIYLQDDDYETLSLSINPLTARVTVDFDSE